jgi:hypothetical protein
VSLLLLMVPHAVPMLLYPGDGQAEGHGNEHESCLQPWLFEWLDIAIAVWCFELVH